MADFKAAVVLVVALAEVPEAFPLGLEVFKAAPLGEPLPAAVFLLLPGADLDTARFLVDWLDLADSALTAICAGCCRVDLALATVVDADAADGRAVALIHEDGRRFRLALLDVTDPARPREIGRHLGEGWARLARNLRAERGRKIVGMMA